MSDRVRDLARLATDPRTPEHERAAAAMALAKAVAKGETPKEPARQASPFASMFQDLYRDEGLRSEIERLRAALDQRDSKIEELKHDKAELEERLREARKRDR